MTEYEKLMNYLCNNPTIYLHKGYEMSVFTRKGLFEMLHELKPSEAPDMYAKYNGKIYIIEHFVFDASKENRNGMAGQRRENEANQIVNSAQADNEWHIEQLSYKVTPLDYYLNFNKHFDSHYSKISTYKDNLIQRGIATKNDVFIVGFWAECLYPPYYCESGKPISELFYFQTKQFREKLLNADDLDFILFSSYAEGEIRLFYSDKITIYGNECVDLESDAINFPSINDNEVIMYGKFSENADNV